MSGVLILTVSTVIVKIIGLAYKIPLLSVLGAEGMGYFNSAYEIYALLCGVATSGMPVAVSMLISSANKKGDIRRENGVYRTASAIMVTKGVLFSGGLAIFAEPIAVLIGNHEAYPAILCISPALFFSCAAGAVRGYFQGKRDMLPTAISQLTEAFGKLLFGVVFALFAIRSGAKLYFAAAMGILGVSLGSLLSALYLFAKKIRFKADSHSNKAPYRCSYFWEIFKISLPITAGSALMGTSRMIDMAFIMRRLQDIGISASDANKIYGSYTTLAIPVFSLVPAFIPPITESLIPRLSAAVAVGDTEEQKSAVGNAFRLTAFLAMPAGMGIILYAGQIISLLFPSSPEAVNIAAPLLSSLGASVLLSCLVTTSCAVLQSYGRVMLPIIALGVGAAVKAVSAYILIGMPDIASLGAPISTLLFNVTVMVLDLIFVCRIVKGKIAFAWGMVKIFVCSATAILASYVVYLSLCVKLDGTALPFLAALACAAVAYFSLCLLLGVIGKDDIAVISHKRLKTN